MIRSEVAGVFGVSTPRANVFEVITQQSRTTTELVNNLPALRSTVDRGLRELEHVGFVRTCDTAHYSTLAGRMTLETYSQFVECLDDANAAAVVLDTLDSGMPLAPVFLDDHKVAPVADDDPGPIFSKLMSFVEETESVRRYIQGVSSSQVDTYYQAVADSSTPVDIAVTGNVVQRLVTACRPRLAET